MTRIRDQHIRGSIAFGAACDAALSVVLTGRITGAGDRSLLLLSILAAAVAALGLIAYGAALNDLLDRRRDAVMSGSSVAAAQATGPNVIIVVGALLLATFAAMTLGRDATYVALVLATLLLFHNAVARFIPAIGLVVPGAVLAGIMLVPDWRMPMPAAVWLAMTIVVLASVVVHVLADKRPVLSRRAVPVVVLGWAVVSVVTLGLRTGIGAQPWPEQSTFSTLLWPLGAVLGLGLVLRWKVATAGSRRQAAAKIIRYVALWQPIIAAAWCASIGAWMPAVVFVVLGVVGLLVVGGYRELAGMSGPAARWR
jgi:hypothetical protein